MMAIGEMLHVLVPALLVAEIRELLEQHAAVLPGDGRHFAVGRAAPIRSVARRAGLEQLGAVPEVGLQRGARDEFAVARSAWLAGLRPGDALCEWHDHGQGRGQEQ